MPAGAHRKSPPQFLALVVSFWSVCIVITLFLAGWVIQWTIVQHKPFFAAAPLGGRFNQLQAKAIDFVSGAIVVPLFMAVATFCWFHISRTIAFDERDERKQQPVSLQALVDLATTETGSYNVFKLWTLARAPRSRFSLFSILVLLAAISSTLFSNVIAYEAYLSPPTPRNLVMKLLNWNWSLRRSDFEPNVRLMNVLNTLSYQNASTLLDEDGAYTRPNLTEVSISNLSSSVVELEDVPAYRQTITCEPAKMEEFNLSKVVGSVSDYMLLSIKAEDEGKFSLLSNFQTYIPGTIASIAQGNPTEIYNFAAYNYKSDGWVAITTKVLLVTATRQANPHMTPHNGSSPSSFGNLPHLSFDLDFGVPKTPDCTTDPGDHDCPGDHGCPEDNPLDPQPGNGTKMEAWGVVCQINFHFGKVSMTRPSTSIWSLSSMSFPDPPVWYYSWIPTLEPGLSQSYHAPASSLGGLGAAISASAIYDSNPCTNCCVGCGNPNARPVVNFTAFAQNYLYADARLLSSVLNYDTCPNCRPDSSLDILVRAVVNDCAIVYRITYISGLLVLGLIVFAAAAAIPLGMMMFSLNAVALRQWRIVDALRMVVDVAQAVGSEIDRDNSVCNWSRAKLGRWAGTVMLSYHIVQGHMGDRIELSVAEQEGGNGSTNHRFRPDEHDEGGDGASQHLLDVLDENDAAP